MTWKATALADSPIALWDLQETAGTTAEDYGGGGYDGTYSGTYALNQTGPQTGMVCVDMNGGAGYVTVADTAAIRGSGSHMSFEFILKAVTPVNLGDYIFQKISSDTNTGWSVETGSDAANKLRLRWSGLNWDPTGSWSGWDANWHHFVVVVDIDTGTGHTKFLLYVDGTLLDSHVTFDEITLTPDTVRPLQLMANNGGFNFPGYIAGAALYGSSLSQSQVTAHYDAYNQSQSANIIDGAVAHEHNHAHAGEAQWLGGAMRISDLPSIIGDDLTVNDLLVVVDVSDTTMGGTGTDKKVTLGELIDAIVRLGG